ncbi:MAG: carbamoyltransferase HypF [Lachnospiraceae bacterium]|jgi:hydrogenase maturation protein HypF
MDKIMANIQANKIVQEEGFETIESNTGGTKQTIVPPDIATCPECLREMKDPSDSRYRYPFINCINCGPGFTIIKGIPYDRRNTTMGEFEMCPECGREYGDIANRRYHAQSIACEKCGPVLSFLKVVVEGESHSEVIPVEGDPVENAAAALKAGMIVAVKGIGGYHLACRADDEAAVTRLRRRKHRDEKPMAIMCKDIQAAESYAVISPEEKRALESPERPIVLLKKHEANEHRHLSENGFIGIMLPYTPVHHLLFDSGLDSLVMTSGNLSELPIIYKDGEAFARLPLVADYFLTHNREIETGCDDSLQWILDGREYPVRRSRGYVPLPVKINISCKTEGILACGAEQKASFALARGEYVYPSRHMGDLKNLETLQNYEEQIRHFRKLFKIEPDCIVCDLHPDYLSTEYACKTADEEGMRLIRVQHHHAHMASCMADNGLDGHCIGIIWDGAGYGSDGTILGSEFLTGGYDTFEREGCIRPIKLAGGDVATKELWRVAVAVLEDAGIDSREHFPGKTSDAVRSMLGGNINCPVSTGMGRLFDAVSALAGVCNEASYEGQGAVLLEAIARENEKGTYSWTIDSAGHQIIDTREMIRAIASDVNKGIEKGIIAAKFMNTLLEAAVEMCRKIREKTGLDRVVLSGGTFQNMFIVKKITIMLANYGFRTYHHSRVPTNDEGLCLGQVAIAARRIQE